MKHTQYLHLPFGSIAITASQIYLNKLADYFVLKKADSSAQRLADIKVIERNIPPESEFNTPPVRVMAHVEFAYLKGIIADRICLVPESQTSAHRIIYSDSSYHFEVWANTYRSHMEFVRFIREVVRSHCLLNKFSCYHASCVSFTHSDGTRHSVAFIGQSGAGKTTFMTEALKALPDASLIANDRVQVGKFSGKIYAVPIPLSVRLIANQAEFECIHSLGNEIGAHSRWERGKVQLSPRLFSTYMQCGMEDFCGNLRVILPRNTELDYDKYFSAADVLSDQRRSYQDPAFPDRWLVEEPCVSGCHEISPDHAVQVPWSYRERGALGARLMKILN